MADLDATFIVVNSKLKKMPGGKAMLLVTVESTYIDPRYEEIPPGEYTIELDWVRQDVAIERHPHFSSEGLCDKADVRQYFDDPDPTKRAALYESFPENTGEPGAGQGSGRYLIDLKLRGIESYAVYAPVVRRTLDRSTPVTNTNCGYVIAASSLANFLKAPVPLANADGQNWVYLQSGARSVRTGRNKRWQRIEEWTGGIGLPSNIYQMAGGTTWYPTA
jgi:hypothetical protein